MTRLTARVRSRSLLLVLAASVAALRAQDDSLVERIAALVETESWQVVPRDASGAEVPLDQLADAVASLHGKLQDHLWARAMWLVTRDPQALLRLWNEQPERRGARTAVFAEAMGNLTGLYVAAKLTERQDLREVARFQRPEPWAEQSTPDGSERRRAEEVLQRARAAADAAAAAEVLQLLRELEPYGKGSWLFAGYYDRHGPFALQQALQVHDATVARRAAIALRLMLGLSVPERLANGGRDDLVLVQAAQNRVPFGVSGQVDFDRLLADLAADRPFVGWGPVGLDAVQRRRLAKALIAYALRVPAPPWDEMSAERPGLRARDLADQQASTALQYAAALGDDEKAAVMALAVASPDVHVTLRVLMAFGAWSRAGIDFEPPLAPELAGRLAPVLLVLLDHPDPMVVARAATVCGKVVPGAPDSKLAAVVGDRAIAALAGKQALYTEPLRLGGFCGTESPRPGMPGGPASWYVFSAAAAGDARLLAPLCAELKKFVDAKGRWQVAPDAATRHELLLLSLVQLARHVDADGARQLHELLTPAFEPAPAARTLGYLSVAQQLTRRVLATALPQLPEELLLWYAALPREERHGMPWTFEDLERLDEARATRLIGRSDEDRDQALRGVPLLCIRVPQRITDAWRAGGMSREAAIAAVQSLGAQHAAALAEQARVGRVPRALAARALASGGLTLSALAAVLPDQPEDLADADSWQVFMVLAIERAPASEAAADLAGLGMLAASPVEQVAFAALRRAVLLGDAGRAVAATALARLADASKDVAALARAMELAVQLGVEPDNLAAVMPRLDDRTSWHARMVADAAAMRFGGLDPRHCRSGYTARAIELAAVDVDEETLRAVIGEPSAQQPLEYVVEPLLRGSAVTIASTLAVLGEQSHWSGSVQRAVAGCAGHDDAKVRLAAYRALATRDAKVWPCALLVHEAVFDPDPAVRRFGESLRR